MSVITKIFGTKGDRDVKRLRPLVQSINGMEEAVSGLSDDKLRGKTGEFRQKLEQGATVDDLLPECFAVVREVGKRILNMRHFDVQLMGGIVLHEGNIAEMKTGEGKTLVATLSVCLNALPGKGVHVVTVNDYLARRDAEWMGNIYRFLGFSVGIIQHDMSDVDRKAAYQADITYGTNNEFGFDYLRDNMKYSLEQTVQRGHHFGIVDEVDSILIDEARTPLIISGPVQESKQSKIFEELRNPVERLVRMQRSRCKDALREGEKALKEGREEDAGRYLLIVQRGMPKNSRLLELKKDSQISKLVAQTEGDMMVAKSLSGFLEEELYFVLDEKGHSIDLTPHRGQTALTPREQELFVFEDIDEKVKKVDDRTDLSPEEKLKMRRETELAHVDRVDQVRAFNQLLRAYTLYEKDVDYVVQDGRVMIVDEFTGRLMPGRRWSDGLHQAVEAKENVKVEGENQTFATVTFQNYFRMYEKLAGMTGTADTEAAEFHKTYKLDVIVIPTNKDLRRAEHPDVIYRTAREKWDAVVEEIEDYHKRGQPMLVGTISIENSEKIALYLKKRGIKHVVLNAKHHQKEAEIVAQAGRKGAVTIATNMAGRGTDILLGGNARFMAIQKLRADAAKKKLEGEGEEPEILESEIQALTKDMETVVANEHKEVVDAGGLHVIGTERHESRRIDNQLRGRSGRQGDPGSSRFFLSLEDDLLRIFGMDRMSGVMQKLGMTDGVPIEAKQVTKAIERAQKQVENRNFEVRKNLIEYDDVMNKQREAIYSMRRDMLAGKDLKEYIDGMKQDVLDGCLYEFADPEGDPEEWDADGLRKKVIGQFGIDLKNAGIEVDKLNASELRGAILEALGKRYEEKENTLTPERMRQFERYILLQIIDSHWKDHLYSMDHLRDAIGLRGYAQRDPLVEYKKESFAMFQEMNETIQEQAVRNLFLLEPVFEDRPRESAKKLQYGAPAGKAPQRSKGTVRNKDKKVGRNDPCPCGSGRKYKKCCGA